MNLLISSEVLDLSGVPTATLTLVEELRKRGYPVTVYSPRGGCLSGPLQAVETLDDVPTPDVILAQHNTCARTLYQKFPSVPLCFYSHGIVTSLEQPPLDLPVARYLAINEASLIHLNRCGVPLANITILRDFINTDRFCPTTPVSSRLERVLYVSNYKRWKHYFAVTRACEQLGLTLKTIGSPYGRSRCVEKEMNECDLVISVGRGILEGMACGRPVIGFDLLRGDGYLDMAAFYHARQHNFGGREYLAQCATDMGTDELIHALSHYQPADGAINREIILNEHGHVRGTDQLLSILNSCL